MPRAFTDAEADRIRQRLMSAGAVAFGRRGVRATGVEQLATEAGISKGAFYRFFDSKEALLIALLQAHEIAQHAEIEAAVRSDPGHGVEVLVDSALNATRDNPLIEVLMSPEGLRALQSLSPGEQQTMLERDVGLVERVLPLLSDDGSSTSIDDQLLVGLLRSLVFVGRHRDEIGDDLVEAVGTWLKSALRNALLAGDGDNGNSGP